MTPAAEVTYPENKAERDLWILNRRADRVKQRETLDPFKPYAFLVEDECFASRQVGPVATIFLTNRECPWRCTMCDLWQNTLPNTVPPGAIPKQIDYALTRLPRAQQLKLYNSGSFFDPRAIPLSDYDAIASLAAPFERVIVESHPQLIGKRCIEFEKQMQGKLEVAMGLETAHPAVLDKLNKGMTLEQYARAADKLKLLGIALRAFILLQPPFMLPAEAYEWTCRSIDFAFDCGAAAISLIPTRDGNGAMEELARAGLLHKPALSLLESSLEYGLQAGHGRVFIDLWNTTQVLKPGCCGALRLDRLREMNLSQTYIDRVACAHCGGHI